MNDKAVVCKRNPEFSKRILPGLIHKVYFSFGSKMTFVFIGKFSLLVIGGSEGGCAGLGFLKY